MTQAKSVSRRNPSTVNAKLERRLSAYVAVASAAGIGMLAAPQAAEAEVVYTPTNVSFQGQNLPIDLNNDGTPDFEIVHRACGSSHSGCLDINPLVAGNGIRGTKSIVAAGFLGVPVGAGEKFLVGDGSPSYGNVMVGFGAYGPYSWSNGAWAHTTNRYLGLRFMINGQTHYAWARLSVNVLHGPSVITGYAYETIPNKTIKEGQTHEANTSSLSPADLFAPAPQPARLGTLARGADGLAIWRRDDEAGL